VLLLFRGRPGRWRFASAEERAREGRRYLPGLVFRLLFLLAVLLAPVLSVLLFPAALLAAFPPRKTWARILAVLAGLLPLLIYAAALTFALAAHLASRKAGFLGGWPAAVLIPGAAVAFVFLMVSRSRPATLQPAPPAI
jgi:hypothetical protein